MRRRRLKVRHHMPQRTGLSLVVCAMWLVGCAATVPPPSSPQVDPVVFAGPGQFGARPDIPDAGDIHALSPVQRDAFLRYLEANSRIPLNRRVYNYLEPITRDFDYQGDTLMAADALTAGRGNCLSLAIVTTALAQLAGGLQAPMARLAGGASNLIAGLARAVDALRAQRESAES